MQSGISCEGWGGQTQSKFQNGFKFKLVTQICCTDQQKAAWFESDFCVTSASYITTLLKIENPVKSCKWIVHLKWKFGHHVITCMMLFLRQNIKEDIETNNYSQHKESECGPTTFFRISSFVFCRRNCHRFGITWWINDGRIFRTFH